MLVVTTRRFRSSAVLIMNKENHSIVRTMLSKSYQTGVTSAKEVVYGLLFIVCCGWCRPSKPHHPKVSFRFLNLDNPQMANHFMVKNIFMGLCFFNKYDNPQITYQKLVKLYLWEKLLSAPRSQIVVSSICD